ncbi:M56 family metallopeptidase [Maribellus sp. YY47]|uniref:M56 family metallopeptidase n=1 Tax=Maribellus sp. YY47 TaxID=2929486 RepID=UPI002001C8EA|nr:M56 family metallopeptidase [Maribellus sp. YY47]MCK3682984.1 tetratricopeptide repeat protein [Maribellus sp. YY47]
MDTPTNYLIATSVCLAFAYLIYLLFFRKETNFRQRRFFLIFAAIFSLLLPTGSYYILLPLTTKAEEQTEVLAPPPVLERPTQQVSTTDFYPVNPMFVPDIEPLKKRSSINLLQVLPYLYFAGLAVLLLRFIVQLVTINVWYNRSRKVKQPLFTLLFHERFSTPFSFFSWIFLTDKKLPETDLGKIIAHESVHVKQRHSFDAVFFELLCIFMWFNPIVWMMRRSINLTHEFLADEGAIQSGIDSLHYQALMVNQVAEANIVSVTSHFNKSMLSQRIKMIANSRLYKKAKYKILVLAPVALVLFLFIAGVNGLNQRKVLYRNLKKDPVISKVFSKDEIKDLVELRLMTDDMVVNTTGESDTKIAYQKFNELLSSRNTGEEVKEKITLPHDSLVTLAKSNPALLQIYEVSNAPTMNFSLNLEGKVMQFLQELSKESEFYKKVLEGIEIAGDISPSNISSFIKEPGKYNMESEAERLYASMIYGFLSNKIIGRNETTYDSKAVELNKSGAAMILNDPEGALDLFNQALEIQPDLPTALMNSANIYIKLHEFEKAKQQLQKLTELRPEEPEYWRVLGLVYDLEGDTQNAMKMYEKSFHIYDKMLNSNDNDELYIAKINLASLYILMGNVEKGTKLYDVLKKEYPDRSKLIEGAKNYTREKALFDLRNQNINDLFHRNVEIIVQHPEEYSKNFLKGIYNTSPYYRRIELKGNQLILNDTEIYSLPDYIDLDKKYQMVGEDDNVQVDVTFTRNTYSSIKFLVNVKQKGEPKKQYTGEAEMLSSFFFGKEWVKDDRKNETFAAEQFLNDKEGEWINIKIGEDGPGKLRGTIETGNFKCPVLRTETTTGQEKDNQQDTGKENNSGSGNAEVIVHGPDDYSSNFIAGLYNLPEEYKKIELRGEILILNDTIFEILPEYLGSGKTYQMEGKDDKMQVELSFTQNTYSSIDYVVQVSQNGEPQKQYTGIAELQASFFLEGKTEIDNEKNEAFTTLQLVDNSNEIPLFVNIGKDGLFQLRCRVENDDFKSPVLRSKNNEIPNQPPLSKNHVGDLRKMNVQTLFARLRFKQPANFMADPDEEKFITYGEIYGNDLTSGIRLDVRKWLSYNDLKFLMSNLESQEPCKSMMNVFSSQRPDVESTIGGFAAMFLDYYRKNQLFHPLAAVSTNNPDLVQELKEWWENYKNENTRYFEIGDVLVKVYQLNNSGWRMGNDFLCRGRIVSYKNNLPVDSLNFNDMEAVGDRYGLNFSSQPVNGMVIGTKFGDYEGRLILIDETGKIQNHRGGFFFITKDQRYIVSPWHSDLAGITIYDLKDRKVKMDKETEIRPVNWYYLNREYYISKDSSVNEIYRLDLTNAKLLKTDLKLSDVQQGELVQFYNSEFCDCN